MCGGFSIISKEKKLFQRFHAEPDNFSLSPRYNARPGQDLPVILGSDPHKIIQAHWGYLPHWAANISTTSDIGTISGIHSLPHTPRTFPRPQINARAETIAAKPFYKDSFLHRRCLILADSFFEWAPAAAASKKPATAALPGTAAKSPASSGIKSHPAKAPWRILLKTGEPFAFAGIWDEIPDHEGTIRPAFAIITVAANKDVSPIHDRMPAILLPEEEAVWLAAPQTPGVARSPGISPSPAALLNLLRPYPNGLLTAYPVSRLVNSAANYSEEVIKEF